MVVTNQTSKVNLDNIEVHVTIEHLSKEYSHNRNYPVTEYCTVDGDIHPDTHVRLQTTVISELEKRIQAGIAVPN